MKWLFLFVEKLVGSRWSPNEYTDEFCKRARTRGYFYARTMAFFRGIEVRRDAS